MSDWIAGISAVLRVLTYNIHKGFDQFNRAFVLDRIRKQLQLIDIDVVLLQEIQGRHDHHERAVYGWPRSPQFEFLASNNWPHYAYAKNAKYSRGHHGNAILSKFEISNWTNLNLSRFRRASRSMLHGKIKLSTSEKPLHLFCVHLDLIGFERKRQIREIQHYIEDFVPDDETLILGGDFNDWQGQLGRRLEDQLGLKEAHSTVRGSYARTFPAVRPFLRMDRIYYRGIDLVDSYCLAQQPWNRLSDHLPLYASFDQSSGESGAAI